MARPPQTAGRMQARAERLAKGENLDVVQTRSQPNAGPRAIIPIANLRPPVAHSTGGSRNTKIAAGSGPYALAATYTLSISGTNRAVRAPG